MDGLNPGARFNSSSAHGRNNLRIQSLLLLSVRTFTLIGAHDSNSRPN
jgi:hypothetical protein